MQAPLWTKEEMARKISIREVLQDYRAELIWAEKNRKAPNFKIHKDPSKGFITAKQKRDFDAWCPVRLLHASFSPNSSSPVLLLNKEQS